MGRGDQRHVARGAGRRGRRRLLRWLPGTVVVLLLAAAAVQARYDVAGRLGWEAPNPRTDPAAVSAPPGVRLPDQAPAAAVAPPPDGGPVSAERVRAAVSGPAHAGALGGHVSVLVAGMDGPVVYRRGGDPMIPASTMKLLTTTAALASLGPMARFRTEVQRVPGSHRIVLVGGGDPFLASTAKAAGDQYPERATTAELARRTATALHRHGIDRVRLAYDDSLFSGPAVNPTWPDTYVSTDVVPPISALWVDEAHDASGGYVARPAEVAAATFERQLEHRGIRVAGGVTDRAAPAKAVTIASVRSAPVGEIVQQTLSVSDNKAAEVLARHVGIAEGRAGSFKGGTRAVVDVLHRLGVRTPGLRMYDGSGLSRKDRLDPDTLIDVLRLDAGAAHPRLRDVITGLPVAGYTGSLRYRYVQAAPAGRGRVRAKTGTLTGVDALAGIATDLSGTTMVFAAMADKVPVPKTLAARVALDRITAALGACRCAAPAATASPGTSSGPSPSSTTSGSPGSSGSP